MVDLDVPAHSYCTHDCLLNLKNGLEVSSQTACPNIAAHLASDLTMYELGQELAQRMSCPETSKSTVSLLGLTGARGVVMKVLLSKSGYCLIAKGFKDEDNHWLQSEEAAYTRLDSLQGEVLPVCCISFSLSQPLIVADGRQIRHVLLLSYGGIPILELWAQKQEQSLSQRYLQQLLSSLDRIHASQVVHGDPELRNVLVDPTTDQVMLVDFERSRTYEGRPACHPSSACRKTYKDRRGRKRKCMYCRELEVARCAILDPASG
ncbi:hypothetical protein RBB50_004354 [Rhinocladiella similis]